MKVLKLALAGALAAISFNVVNAATVLVLDQPHVTSDPSYVMTLTFEETTRADEVKVTFKAVNVGSHYVDGFALNLPEGLNYNRVQLGGSTAESGFFQAPQLQAIRDNFFGPNQGGQGIFDLGVTFATGRNKPSNVLFTTGDELSFLVTSTQGPLSVADLAETFDTPTDTWIAAASVVTSPNYCAWYTPEGGTSIPEPSSALLGLLGLGALARRKR